MKLPIVIDNIIEKNLQEKIKNTLLSDDFNWFYITDVTHVTDNKQQRPGFQHRFVVKEKINSDYHNLILPIIQNSCNHINYHYTKIIQGRSFLQLPLSLKDTKIDTPHIDLFDKHLVVLYYVLDSDGDTVIYKNKFYKKEPIPYFEDLKELKRVTPKQGRVVLFDGSHWHTSNQPKDNVRCIINYNVTNK